MDDGSERRRHRRVPVDLPGELAKGDGRDPVRVLDLSLGGALIQPLGFPNPELGEELELILDLAGQHLVLSGLVVRRSGEHCAAMCFDPMDGRHETALARFVQEQDRKLLRAHLHLRG